METKYVSRDIEPRLFRDFGLITAIVGPRRSGKTTLIKKIVENVPNILFLNLDHLAEREVLLRSGNALLEKIKENSRCGNVSEIPKPYHVVIDEAQKVPEIFESIKILYDEYPDVFRFILSGSSIFELYGHSTETLAGRIRYLHLLPFSLTEKCRAVDLHPENNDFFSRLISGMIKPDELEKTEIFLRKDSAAITKLIDDSLVWGGFPAVFLESDIEARRTYLQSYKETYLERDVRSVPGIKNFTTYSNMLDLMADYEGQIIEYKSLAELLGLSHQTMKKYLSVLDATFLHYFLSPFIRSAKRRIVKSSKSYFADMGLVSYLKKLYDLDALKKTGSVGARFESWVLSEIHKTVANFNLDIKTYFWRTSGGVEIDCVCSGEHIVPVEIKYSSQPDRQTLRAMKFFREQHKAPYGVVIYNGPFKHLKEENIYYIPAWMMA